MNHKTRRNKSKKTCSNKSQQCMKDICIQFESEAEQRYYDKSISLQGPITKKVKQIHWQSNICYNIHNFRNLLNNSSLFCDSKFPNFFVETGYNVNNSNWSDISDEYILNGENHTIFFATSKRGKKEPMNIKYGLKNGHSFDAKFDFAETGIDSGKHDCQPTSVKNGRGIGLLGNSSIYIYSNNDDNREFRVKMSFSWPKDYINHLKQLTKEKKPSINDKRWRKEMAGILLFTHDKKIFKYWIKMIQHTIKTSPIRTTILLPIIKCVLQTSSKQYTSNDVFLQIKGVAGNALKSDDILTNINDSDQDETEDEKTVHHNKNNGRGIIATNTYKNEEDFDLHYNAPRNPIPTNNLCGNCNTNIMDVSTCDSNSLPPYLMNNNIELDPNIHVWNNSMNNNNNIDNNNQYCYPFKNGYNIGYGNNYSIGVDGQPFWDNNIDNDFNNINTQMKLPDYDELNDYGLEDTSYVFDDYSNHNDLHLYEPNLKKRRIC